MSEEAEVLVCGVHGEQAPAFVCQHLAESKPGHDSIGFNWNCEGGDLLANCNGCEAHADAEGFLTDEFFEENFVVICRACFVELATANGVALEAIATAEAESAGDLGSDA